MLSLRFETSLIVCLSPPRWLNCSRCLNEVYATRGLLKSDIFCLSQTFAGPAAGKQQKLKTFTISAARHMLMIDVAKKFPWCILSHGVRKLNQLSSNNIYANFDMIPDSIY